jgi:hypothetical protein
MGCEMFDAARTLARAGLAAQGSGQAETLDVQLFQRFYGNDFSPDQRERIIARLIAASARM